MNNQKKRVKKVILSHAHTKKTYFLWNNSWKFIICHAFFILFTLNCIYKNNMCLLEQWSFTYNQKSNFNMTCDACLCVFELLLFEFIACAKSMFRQENIIFNYKTEPFICSKTCRTFYRYSYKNYDSIIIPIWNWNLLKENMTDFEKWLIELDIKNRTILKVSNIKYTAISILLIEKSGNTFRKTYSTCVLELESTKIFFSIRIRYKIERE